MAKGTLRLLEAQGADAARWEEALAPMPGADIYFTPAYVRLFAELDGDEAAALLWETPRGRVLFPLQIRDLSRLPFWQGAVQRAGVPRARYDATSPYGYSGPLTDVTGGPHAMELVRDFLDVAKEELRSRGLVSLFVRFNPMSGNAAYFPEDALDLSKRSDTVFMDLESSWYKQLSSACHYEVRKSERRGVTVEAAEAPAEWATFGEIYRATMRRRSAREWYIFPQSFLDATREALPGRVTLLLARREGVVLGGSLFLKGFGKGHYHLSGVAAEAAGLGIANRLVVEGARLCAAQGCRTLHLGGGVTPGDGLSRFKASFSPLRAVWEKACIVLEREPYAALVEASRESLKQGEECPEESSGGPFPAYRRGFGASASRDPA